MLSRLFGRGRRTEAAELLAPEPLSQEVLGCIAAQFLEGARAEVARALLGYRQAPVNFGRMRVLDAARGEAAAVARLVECGNRYGQGWTLHD